MWITYNLLLLCSVSHDGSDVKKVENIQCNFIENDLAFLLKSSAENRSLEKIA